MTKQTIEVEVPEGWKVKEYRMPNKGDYFWHQNRVCVASSSFIDQRLIIEKIQPRRIVLEETLEETNEGIQHFSCGNSIQMTFTNTRYKWSEVKEPTIDSMLGFRPKPEDMYNHNEVKETEEPTLGLSVRECKALFTGNWPLIRKIREFIKENS